MPLWALAALGDKGREKEKKNLIDNGLSSTLFSLGTASIRCEHIFSTLEIIASYACALERVYGSLAHVIRSLKWSVFEETVSWVLHHYCKHVLYEGEICANIRLKLMKQNNTSTTSFTTIIRNKFVDEDFNITKSDQNGYTYRLHLHPLI